MSPENWRAATLLVLLTACGQEYGVKAQPDYEPPGDTGDVSLYPTGSAEMFAPWCPEEDDLPDSAGTNETCAKEAVTGTIEAVVEWSIPQWSNYGESSQVVMAPVVGQLDDDNGDGVVDRDDVPDIVVITDDEGLNTQKKGILRVVPGNGLIGGRAVQRVDLEEEDTNYQVYPYRYSNAALGDIDNDGEAEIVIVVLVMQGPDEGDSGSGSDTSPPVSDSGGGGGEGSSDDIPIFPDAPEPPHDDHDEDGEEEHCYVAAFAPDLTLDWVSHEAAMDCGGHAPAIADLDADGDPEVIVGDYALSGADGAVLWQGGRGVGAYSWHPETGFHPVPADLDGDGFMEVVTGRSIYDYRGNVLCDSGSEEDDGYAAVADFNMDGVGEVVSVGNGLAKVFGMDCMITASWPIAGSGNGGPPTIADFDGDAEPEIGIASGTRYAVYEPDGSMLWSTIVADESSASTGSAVYDFEGDGRAEIVYADESSFWIFDGLTGDVRYERDDHASRTLHEFPTVADVDGDGLPEIIIPNGGGHQAEDLTGITVLGSANLDWLPGRQVWNQHAFSLTNINDDLSVPAPAQSNWPLHNNFRSGDPQPVSGSSSPDVVPLAELCTLECARDTLVVRIRLGNEGAAIMRRDVPVSLYAEDISGFRTYLGSAFSLAEVEPGETTDTMVLRVDWSGYDNQNLVVVADDD
jgi:hypothetical protein